jgi:hypothetical protein
MPEGSSRPTVRLQKGLTQPMRPVLRETVEASAQTDAMQARRREIERKKRDWRLEQEHLREDAQEGWVRVWKTVGWIVLVAGVIYLYWRLQLAYGNNWPTGVVWGAMAAALLAGIIWMLWYVNKSDL